VLYKRISGVQSVTELDDLQAETMDRFGPLPDPAKNLFRIARLRVAAAPLAIERMDVSATSGSVTFGDGTPLDPGALILLLQKSSKTMRFDGPKKIRFTGQWETTEARFVGAQKLLESLARCVPAGN
jgi:transcription-repair coupling factor (superfamily II helicase)